MLGEHLPPLTLLLKDALGNAVPMQEVPAGLTFSCKAAPASGQAAELEWEASEVDVLPNAQLVSPSLPRHGQCLPFAIFTTCHKEAFMKSSRTADARRVIA